MNKKNIGISYCITVCDELSELTKLTNFLHPQVREDDELLIQYDSNKVSDSVMGFLQVFEKMHDNVKITGYSLNGDFGKFKSNLREHSSKEFIFQIDADEIPNQYLIQGLPQILNGNSEIDMFFVPRINTVDGLTEKHVKKWGWKVQKFESQKNTKKIDANSDEYKYLDKLGYITKVEANDDEDEIEITYFVPIINFPDYQTRLYRNTPEVEWLGKVHEKITGYDSFTALPAEEQYCLYHPKDIDKQEKQNNFYEKI